MALAGVAAIVLGAEVFAKHLSVVTMTFMMTMSRSSDAEPGYEGATTTDARSATSVHGMSTNQTKSIDTKRHCSAPVGH